MVLDQRPARDHPVGIAYREHRELAGERDQRFEDERDVPELGPGVVEIGRRTEHALPLAVVAASAGLQDRGQTAHLVDRVLQLGARPDRGERRGADAEPTEGLLLGQAVLCHLERARPRAYRGALGEKPRRGSRDPLPLVGDDGGTRRDLGQRGFVAEVTDDEVADRRGRRARDGVEEPEAQAEGDPGEPEHPTELAAPQHRYEIVGHPVLSSASLWLELQVTG